MPDLMGPVFETFGVDFKEKHGRASFALPVPAALLVDQQGVVRDVFVEPDYAKRVEEETVLGWLERLGLLDFGVRAMLRCCLLLFLDGSMYDVILYELG